MGDTKESMPAQSVALDPAEKLLAAIEEVRDEARERDKRVEARFSHLESQLADVVSKTDGNTKLIGEQAEAITRVASAAAKAADLGLEAKQQAARAPDDTSKMIESAMRIHRSSIADTVDIAVREAVQPISEKVDTQNEAVGAIVDELGLEDRVELGREVKPGEKPPVRTLKKMARENKTGTAAALLTFLAVVVKLAIEMLKN